MSATAAADPNLEAPDVDEGESTPFRTSYDGARPPLPRQGVSDISEELSWSLAAGPKRHGCLTLAWWLPILALALSIASVYGVSILLLNPSSARLWDEPIGEHPGAPGGGVFDLMTLLIACTVAGKLSAVVSLPPLFGMLLAGFALRQASLTTGISALLNAKVRDVALAVIMIRAGLGLDLRQLWRRRGLVLALSLVPCAVETLACALSSAGFGGLPLGWGLLLGFLLADVSPAVTVPLLTEFHERGFGRAKGIPTILLASSGLNSVVAIVGYGTVFSFVFNDGSLPAWAPAVLGGVEIVGLGLAGGMALGSLVLVGWSHSSPTTRLLMLGCLGTLTIQLGKRLGMAGGGCLASIFLAAWMGRGLRARGELAQLHEVSAMMAQIWAGLGQPLLFGLLGASVDLTKLSPDDLATGVGVVGVGLAMRGAATYGCVRLGAGWSLRERLFAVITWCPKATVQAALAGVALDHVTLRGREGLGDQYDVLRARAELLLTTGVLSILLTAPLFAVLMWYTGRRWLAREGAEAAGGEDLPAPYAKAADGPFTATSPRGKRARVNTYEYACDIDAEEKGAGRAAARDDGDATVELEMLEIDSAELSCIAVTVSPLAVAAPWERADRALPSGRSFSSPPAPTIRGAD